MSIFRHSPAPPTTAHGQGDIVSSVQRGFTLIEALVASAILSLILALMLTVLTQASDLWKSANARLDAFQSARLGFESLTKILSQASLNTYWDYDDPNNPGRYIRKSELHFLVDEADEILSGGNVYGQGIFFQAPANFSGAIGAVAANDGRDSYLGLTDLLNACGFYVEFASDRDKGWVPDHVENHDRSRFRLMQWLEGTQNLSIYSTSGNAWISSDVLSESFPIAENIITLVARPKEPEKQAVKVLPDQYHYDSQENALYNPQPPNAHQLPPMLEIAMVAMDETSAIRLGDQLESTIQGCLTGLFQDPSTQFEDDLKTLAAALTNKNITHRIFVSVIPLHEAKWSP